MKTKTTKLNWVLKYLPTTEIIKHTLTRIVAGTALLSWDALIAKAVIPNHLHISLALLGIIRIYIYPGNWNPENQLVEKAPKRGGTTQT